MRRRYFPYPSGGGAQWTALVYDRDHKPTAQFIKECEHDHKSVEEAESCARQMANKMEKARTEEVAA